jgi:hypothetical protein
MFKITRARLVLLWFAGVTAFVLLAMAMGAGVTASTAVFLLAVSLIPPAIVLMLWPGRQPPTVAEVLHSGDGKR